MPDDRPQLTVAICTRNRSGLLAQALEALSGQTAGTDAFEVLVVDNASTDGTAAVARGSSSRFRHFRHVPEPTLGLSHARNTALRQAAAPWVCFLDDDSLAAPDYVAVALPVCRQGRFACFGGAVRPWRRDPLPAWFLDEYESGSLRDIREVSPVPEGSFVFGNNMVVRTDAALGLGGFDPALGMRGDAIAYGEETDLQARMKAAGHAVGYVPDLVVRHYARPEKYTVRRQLEMQYRSGAAWQTISGDTSAGMLCAILVKLFISPARGACISARRLAAGGYRWQNALIETGGRLCFGLGRLLAWQAMRTASKRVPPCRR